MSEYLADCTLWSMVGFVAGLGIGYGIRKAEHFVRRH